jgi:hypothetical protein
MPVPLVTVIGPFGVPNERAGLLPFCTKSMFTGALAVVELVTNT